MGVPLGNSVFSISNAEGKVCLSVRLNAFTPYGRLASWMAFVKHIEIAEKFRADCPVKQLRSKYITAVRKRKYRCRLEAVMTVNYVPIIAILQEWMSAAVPQLKRLVISLFQIQKFNCLKADLFHLPLRIPG